MFERSYNAYQSDYFSKHEDERYSCSLQTASGSAYNDILEHTVQGGIFGGMFYLAFIVMIIISALRYSSKYEQSAIWSLILMSLVNTIYCSISVWIIMIAFVVIITCNGPSLILSNYKKEIIANTSLCFFFVMLIKVFSMTYAQARFKILKDNGDRNMVSLNDLKNNISTSEAYYSYLAECYEYYNDNENAYNCYRKATDYSFAPMLLYREAKSAEKCNKNGEAIRILLIATNMLPGHMSLKYYLMCTYMSGHKCHEARNVAREILEKQCKNTENNEIIKQEAYAILNSNF